MTPGNVAMRVGVTILLTLGGFAYPLLFALAALMAWALISDLRNPSTRAPDPDEPRRSATAAEPNWKRHWLAQCESPAEEVFLEAMIANFALLPDKGDLRGPEIWLQLQVVLPPYRADFLVNNRLLVEIDGAQHRATRQAIEWDRERDARLAARGYRTLRIAAKVVFTTPYLAMKLVGDEISKIGPGSGPIKPAAEPETGFWDVMAQANRKANQMLEDQRAEERRKAEAPPLDLVEVERRVKIEVAQRTADRPKFSDPTIEAMYVSVVRDAARRAVIDEMEKR